MFELYYAVGMNECSGLPLKVIPHPFEIQVKNFFKFTMKIMTLTLENTSKPEEKSPIGFSGFQLYEKQIVRILTISSNWCIM